MAGSAITGWLTWALLAAAPAPQSAEAPPSAELLLYFGEFEDASGDFVDPLALESVATDAQEDDELDESTETSEDEHDDAQDP